MRNYKLRELGSGLGVTIVLLVVFVVCIKGVTADLDSGWLSVTTPQLAKVADLPDNVVPAQANRDCTTMMYTKPDLSIGNDCFVATGQGLIQQSGGLLIPPNTQTGYPLSALLPPTSAYVVPIPGRPQTLLISPATGIGSYVSVYDDLGNNLKPSYDLFPFRHVSSYGIDRSPNRTIIDKTGTKIAFNVYGTLGFSANGKWAVVDALTRGMLRINLSTLEITPFADSFNSPNDYSDRRVVTAISNDGRYVATSFYQSSEFKVYDLSSCSGATNASYSQPLDCRYRNYWPATLAAASGFKNIYRLRFTNDDNLSLDMTYNWTSSASFRVGIFRLTAPGRTAHAIDYLALGDSYTSGQGSFVYKAGTDTVENTCHLSVLAYPYLVGASFNSYNSVACSGAKTKDIIGSGFSEYATASGGRQATGKESSSYDPEIFSNFLPGYRLQQDFIERYQPSIVTVSIGGNDMGFGAMMQACATPSISLPPVSNTCFDNYYDRMQVVRAIQATYTKLRSVLQSIKATDPGVRLYVVGYPQIAASGNCAANVHLNNDEIIFSEHLIAYLNSVVRKAAQSTGTYYVDVENAFDGHRMCETTSDQIAINGLTRGNDAGAFGFKVIGSESFHPNQLGNRLLARSISTQTTGLTAVMPTAVAVAAPTAYDPAAQILLNNYVIGAQPLPAVATVDESITTDTLIAGKPQPVSVNGKENGLRPNSNYQVSVGTAAESKVIATVTSDANGDIATPLMMPTTVPTGPQTLRLNGLNTIDQTIVIYKYIYVAVEEKDYDGDGIDNENDPCIVVPASKLDADNDGIDDACDPQIDVKPAGSLVGQVYLTDNRIVGYAE